MKRIFLILAGIFGLLLVTLLTVPFFVPKAVYRAQIEKAATGALNREVVLSGDVRISVFPRISASVGGITVANPDGFTAPNMIEAGELRGSVKWLPLLSRRVEVQELAFIDADVQLEKLADGRTNWDFGAGDAQDAAPAGDGGGVQASIGRASLKNASLTYRDDPAGKTYELKDLDLDASMQGFDKPLKAKAGGVFQGQAFEVALTLDTPEALQGGAPAALDLQLDSGLARGTYTGTVTLGAAPSLDGMLSFSAPDLSGLAAFAAIDLPVNVAPLGGAEMKGAVSGPVDALLVRFDELALKGGLVRLAYAGTLQLGETARVEGTFDALATDTGDLLARMGIDAPARDALERLEVSGKVSGPADAVRLSGLDAVHNGALLDAHFRGDVSLADGGRLNGRIDASSGNLRALLDAAEVELPPGQTMQAFSASGDLSGTFSRLSIAGLSLTLDDIKATGTAGIDLSGEKPRLTGDLDMGTLDLSPFLASADQERKPQQPMQGWSKAPLDLAGLRSVDADLKLSTTSLTLGNVTLGHASVISRLQNGRLEADLPSFAAFGGDWSGRIAVDAAGPKPAVSLTMNGEQVGIASLLGTLAGFDRLTGSGAFSVTASASGQSIDEIMHGLNGEIRTNLSEGAIKGLNIAQLVRSRESLQQALASGKLQGLDFASVLSPEAETDFTSFQTVLSVRNGVAQVDLMKLLSPVLGIDGTGNINLGGQTLDLRLATSIDRKAQGAGSVIQLNGIPVPVRLSGSWTKPKVTPDLSGVADALKADVQGKLLESIGGKLGGTGTGSSPLPDILGLPGTTGKSPSVPPAEEQAPANGSAPEGEAASPEDLAEKAAREALGNLIFGKKKSSETPDEPPEND